MAGQAPTLVEGLSIERVLFVQRMERKAGFTFEAISSLGHDLNVVERGRIRAEICGQTYQAGHGDVVWFHEGEQLRVVVLEAPWVFYTIRFVAPSLPPPDYIHRRIPLPHIGLLDEFDKLLLAWRDTSFSQMVRAMRVQGRLLQLLSEFITPGQQAGQFDRDTPLWWRVEWELRKDLSREIDMDTICRIAQRSAATVTRSCRRAVGVSPLRRLRLLRLSMAHGFVILSNLTISEIANRVGYARVHELSRDYHKQFGLTPTENRKQYPKTYEREFGLPLKTDRK